MRVGIDLGTTFSAVAMMDNGVPRIIKNSINEATTPSVLAFLENGEILFGQEAKDEQAAGNANTASFFKRSMGVAGFSLNFYGKSYNPTDLSSILLRKIKEEAEKQTGEVIDEAVITVPAYFTHRERSATIEAGERAGLKVLAIINEPTAAAISYGVNKQNGSKNIMIYDLGGGTFDVTIAHIDDENIKVMGSDGDHALGGKDWDDAIINFLKDELLEKYDVDVEDDWEAMATLRVLSETAKKKLSEMDNVDIPTNFEGVRAKINLSNEVFETITEHLMSHTADVINRLMESINIFWKDIDGVILVGGSTKMRMIKDYVRKMSGKEPLGGVHPDEAVALGAAISAASIPETKTLSLKSAKPHLMLKQKIRDVTAHAMGTIAISPDGKEYINDVIIKQHTPIPAKSTKSYIFKTGRESSEMDIYVTNGHEKRPLDNEIPHKYVITDIAPTEGETKIDITYEYDTNCVIVVTATQEGRKGNLPIRIEKLPEDMSWTDEEPKKITSLGDLSVILAIDMSGSMAGNAILEARKAMLSFVNTLEQYNAKIGLLPFADKYCLIHPINDNYDRLNTAISQLEINGKYGYCNDAEPFEFSYQTMEKLEGKKYIVVLTDGVWSDNASHNAIKYSKLCHNVGIEVAALGFGGAREAFLKQIASLEDLSSLTDLSNLTNDFSRIAQAIGTANGKLVAKY